LPGFLLSDSTGITAETLGNTLLTQFPAIEFDRTTIPFILNVQQARAVVDSIDDLVAGGLKPIVFSTAVSTDIRATLATCKGTLVDLLGTYLGVLEEALATRASHEPGRAHGQNRGQTDRHRRAGRRQPGRVLRLQAGPARPGAPPSSSAAWARRRCR
jgi:regulator of PEP synthase PpsR (kinase-PPPase family)